MRRDDAAGPRGAMRFLGLAAFWIIVASSAGCSAAPPRAETYDPWQGFNRWSYGFNDRLDKAIVKPAADVYERTIPKAFQQAFANFFDNLSYPHVVLNDLLQGKGGQALADTGRFVINSTLGAGGFWDVASPMGLKPHEEDFGQTLGRWGAGEGAYVVYPFLGPNTVRDTPDLALMPFTNLLFYLAEASVTVPLVALSVIDTRARAKGAFEFIDTASLDPYLFSREAYRQRRTFLIYDGHPPQSDLLDETMLEPSPPDQAQ